MQSLIEVDLRDVDLFGKSPGLSTSRATPSAKFVIAIYGKTQKGKLTKAEFFKMAQATDN